MNLSEFYVELSETVSNIELFSYYNGEKQTLLPFLKVYGFGKSDSVIIEEVNSDDGMFLVIARYNETTYINTVEDLFQVIDWWCYGEYVDGMLVYWDKFLTKYKKRIVKKCVF